VSRLENELRRALDKIYANDALKTRTESFLKSEINKRSQSKVRPSFRLAAVCSAILLFIFMGGFSHNLYFTPVAYVDVDVNPSIGLLLNRFDRVIETHAYNDDGTTILADVNIRFKSYGDATRVLLEAITSKDYLMEDGLITVTVQTGGNIEENNMLERLNQVVSASLSEHPTTVQIEIFPVTSDVRINAHEHHVTPAKFLAISELQAIDPTVTLEECSRHSIGEIRERTRVHGNNHHNEDDYTQETESIKEPTKIDNYETNEHHEDSNDNKHSTTQPNNNKGSHYGDGENRNRHH
jgi:hypothetical protein